MDSIGVSQMVCENATQDTVRFLFTPEGTCQKEKGATWSICMARLLSRNFAFINLLNRLKKKELGI